MLCITQATTDHSSPIAEMFKDMIGRRLGFDEGLLVVIAGSKGLAKAVGTVVGSCAVIQQSRCTRWPTFCTNSTKQIAGSRSGVDTVNVGMRPVTKTTFARHELPRCAMGHHVVDVVCGLISNVSTLTYRPSRTGPHVPALKGGPRCRAKFQPALKGGRGGVADVAWAYCLMLVNEC